MAAFFSTLPRSVEESARMDGLSSFSIFRRVMLPLSLPALMTISVFNFIMTWNDYLFAATIINDPAYMTLPVGMQFSILGFYTTYYNTAAAGAIISAIPSIIFYLFFQKYMLRGIGGLGLVRA
jgi:ABC-type glycerol-3-phosphate transport system permease component